MSCITSTTYRELDKTGSLFICSIVGSSPTWSANEVTAMRGSKIAKQIEHELKREARRKKVILELRRRLLKERGEQNGDNSYNGSNNRNIGSV